MWTGLKTKTTVFGNQTIDQHIELDGVAVENVEEFEYLGSVVTWDNDCSNDIQRRIQKASGAITGLNTVWKRKGISIETKLRVLNVCVTSVLTYAAGTWTVRKKDEDKLKVFQMKCFRRILNIRWQWKI